MPGIRAIILPIIFRYDVGSTGGGVRPGGVVEESASPRWCRPQQAAPPDELPVLAVLCVADRVSGIRLSVILD